MTNPNDTNKICVTPPFLVVSNIVYFCCCVIILHHFHGRLALQATDRDVCLFDGVIQFSHVSLPLPPPSKRPTPHVWTLTFNGTKTTHSVANIVHFCALWWMHVSACCHAIGICRQMCLFWQCHKHAQHNTQHTYNYVQPYITCIDKRIQVHLSEINS